MDKDIKVSVNGLGYVGLPTSAVIASKGIKVLGYDVNKKIVEIINHGDIHIVEPDLKGLVSFAVKNGFLKAYNKPQKADVYIISVPTPLDPKKNPDVSYVNKAVASILDLLEPGNLVIIESTCPVGTTHNIVKLVYKARKDLRNKIYIAYCPERVLPGNVIYELINNDRIVGGITPESSEKAEKFYKLFVKGRIYKTNDRTAELSKLVENAYRDVNIAFANELSIICDELNINTWELIELANKHPRVNILQPGPGVGGHCIAVDPWFIVHSSKKNARLIKTAREVNNYKTEWVINKIVDLAKKVEKPVIACLGLSYKANIDDVRESPSLEIVEKLVDMNIGQVMVCDPYVEKKNISDKIVFSPLEEILKKANIIVLLVDHNEFKEVDKQLLKNKLVLDTKGVWR